MPPDNVPDPLAPMAVGTSSTHAKQLKDAEYGEAVQDQLAAALTRLDLTSVVKTGGLGTFDLMRGQVLKLLADEQDYKRTIMDLGNDLHGARRDRDVAVARLRDQIDINLLHTTLLSVGTFLIGAYASYDSSGKPPSANFLFYAGGLLVAAWISYLVRRLWLSHQSKRTTPQDGDRDHGK